MSEDVNPEPTEESKADPKTEINPDKGPASPTQPLRIEVLDRITTLVAASFGFVAAFAWNETFKTIFLAGAEEQNHPIILIVYALMVTIIAVLLIIGIARAAGKAKARLQ